MAKHRRRREYLILLDKAKSAVETAIDTYNRVKHPYRNETTLMLLSNGWELLAKSILVHKRESISQRVDRTIPAEVAVRKLLDKGIIDKNQSDVMQQVISLRNQATHQYLPEVPDEVMQHLLFFACKFFRDTTRKHFPRHSKDLDQNFLSLSFDNLTTYADKVRKIVSRVKKNDSDKTIAWLLERGITFDGSKYITKKQFENKYNKKNRIMPYLAINDFVNSSDMVRIIPVEAPTNSMVDISLREGSPRDPSLPVVVRKTSIEKDYPYLTKELANILEKPVYFVTCAVKDLDFKGNPLYHQSIKTSKSSAVQRYSESAKNVLQETLSDDPSYDPR